MHCEFRIGSAKFFVSEELPEHGGTPSLIRLGGTTVAIHLYVNDCDAMVKTMEDNDSTVLMAPVDTFCGERFARVRDPFGHERGISTLVRQLTPDEIKTAAARMFSEIPEKTNGRQASNRRQFKIDRENIRPQAFDSRCG